MSQEVALYSYLRLPVVYAIAFVGLALTVVAHFLLRKLRQTIARVPVTLFELIQATFELERQLIFEHGAYRILTSALRIYANLMILIYVTFGVGYFFYKRHLASVAWLLTLLVLYYGFLEIVRLAGNIFAKFYVHVVLVVFFNVFFLIINILFDGSFAFLLIRMVPNPFNSLQAYCLGSQLLLLKAKAISTFGIVAYVYITTVLRRDANCVRALLFARYKIDYYSRFQANLRTAEFHHRMYFAESRLQ